MAQKVTLLAYGSTHEMLLPILRIQLHLKIDNQADYEILHAMVKALIEL